MDEPSNTFLPHTVAVSIGSVRVLQKCAFRIIGKNEDFANGRREDTEEYILRLDLDRAHD